VSKGPDKKKKIEKFNIYLGRCMFCGLCEDYCVGKGVIHLTKEYEVAGYSRMDTIYDLKRLTRSEEGEE
jgi:formate hydrogenlyase subunit 6/NADH:ubiquinone oxidoreductase subunit I